MASRDRQSLYVEGLAEVQAELRAMDVVLRREVQVVGRQIADAVAADVRGAASTRAEVKAAATVKRSGNMAIRAGGGGTPPARMFYGTEFGGQGQPRTQQFRPHLGKQGYFFWPTIRRESAHIVAMWLKVLDKVVPDRG
jgi:hypothetical protein